MDCIASVGHEKERVTLLHHSNVAFSYVLGFSFYDFFFFFLPKATCIPLKMHIAL